MAKKTEKLNRGIRVKADYQRRVESGLYVPKEYGDFARASWPVCATCHQDVDSVNVEDVEKDRVTIRAKCHGEECVVVMEFPYSIQRRSDEDTFHHVKNAINTAVFFTSSIAL